MSRTLIAEAWTEIEGAGQSGGRMVFLNDAASVHLLEEFEINIGHNLPDEFRASYLRHDGQNGDGDDLIDDWQLMSLVEIAQTWTQYRTYWSRHTGESDRVSEIPCAGSPLLPFAADGLGNFLLVNLESTTSSAVVEFRHERNTYHTIAESYTKWLQSVASQLKRETMSSGHSEEPWQIPSMQTLAELIGLSMADDRFGRVIPLGAFEQDRDGPDTLLHSHVGIDITAHRGVVRQIDVYLSPLVGDSVYGANLIDGILRDDDRSAIREKLGRPVEQDRRALEQYNDQSGWDAFIIEEVRIQFNYRSEWKGVSWITMTPADS